MKKPNIVLALICFHIFLTAAISQTAKFDIVTYTAQTEGAKFRLQVVTAEDRKDSTTS